jgi:hypothetical protein
MSRAWLDGARKGDEAAVDALLSRPVLLGDAARYWATLQELGRDRPRESVSMGMAGGIILPRPVPLETIRREGRRLGYEGEALEDFVTIIARADDFSVEVDTKRAAEDAKAAALSARKK